MKQIMWLLLVTEKFNFHSTVTGYQANYVIFISRAAVFGDYMFVNLGYRTNEIRDGPFYIRGGGWYFLKKIVCFRAEAKKIKSLQQS